MWFPISATLANHELHAEAKQEDIQSQQRALDFVELFLRKQPESPHILLLFSALLDVSIRRIEIDEAELIAKAKRILKSAATKPKAHPPAIPHNQALAFMNRLHTVARSAPSTEIVGLCSICSIFLCRVLLPSSASEVTTVYADSLRDFGIRKSSSVAPGLFIDFAQRFPATSWQLRKVVYEVLGAKAATAYRAVQCMQLLHVLLKGMAEQVSETGTEPCMLLNLLYFSEHERGASKCP